jgi:hypothetical protein
VLGAAPGDGQSVFAELQSLLARLPVAVARGELGDARAAFSEFVGLGDSSDRQDTATYLLCESLLLRAEGKLREAVQSARAARDLWERLSQFHYATRALVEEAEALLELDELDEVDRLLTEAERIPAVRRRPLLDAQQTRLRAKLGGRRGDPSAGEGYVRAALAFRDLQLPFWHAITLLEHGELLVQSDAHGSEPALSEARAIFERLEARRWVERTARLQETPAQVAGQLAAP